MNTYKFELGYSDKFETRFGVLSPSLIIVGKVYLFKEFLKEKFPSIKYTDLVFPGNTIKVLCMQVSSVL